MGRSTAAADTTDTARGLQLAAIAIPVARGGPARDRAIAVAITAAAKGGRAIALRTTITVESAVGAAVRQAERLSLDPAETPVTRVYRPASQEVEPRCLREQLHL